MFMKFIIWTTTIINIILCIVFIRSITIQQDMILSQKEVSKKLINSLISYVSETESVITSETCNQIKLLKQFTINELTQSYDEIMVNRMAIGIIKTSEDPDLSEITLYLSPEDNKISEIVAVSKNSSE